MSSLLSRLFPMPRILNMEGGGIEISDRSIKYMRFEMLRGGRFRISSFGELSIPSGVVVDGQIIDHAALVGILRQVRARSKFALCAASLPEGKGYLFSDQLLREAGNNLEESLAVALPSHVPLAPAEAVFDCEVIEHESTTDKVSVVAAAVAEELAENYAQALTEAGFLPISFELEPQAAARAVLPWGPGDRGHATIIADLGEDKNMLCVVEAGIPRFTTSSEGSASIDAALSSQGVTSAEIIRRKIDIGLAHGPHPETHIFLQLAERIAAEISRLAIYWNEKSDAAGAHARVDSAVLYGGNANIKGLPEFLSRKVGFPVRVAPVWQSFGSGSHIPPIAADQAQRFATVAGLALRAMPRILQAETP